MAARNTKPRGCTLPAILAIVAPFAVILLCMATLGFWKSQPVAQLTPGPATPTELKGLRVAFSPEKATLFNELMDSFNKQGLKTADGEAIEISGVQMDPEAMIDAALGGQIDAINPDSSIWLDQLDRAWASQKGTETPVVGETVRYAISPVVIAMWQDVAQSMGYPDKRIGWQDLISKARSDSNFGWSHPSTSSASGLLTTLAMFYAGSGKTRGLTIEDAKADNTLQYVGAVEKTVRQYGEGEWAVVQRVIQDGRQYIDAFVAQEQLVIYYNSDPKRDRLVAIYPAEGSMWEDHPLALLETPTLTSNKRAMFQKFREFVTSKPAQERVLASGFRPTDLSIPINGPASPIATKNGVNPSEPQTTLQIPSPNVVEVVRDVWWYTKRHTNVYLVVDTSGSMAGDKLDAAREALNVFLDQIKGDQERVGIVEFSSSVNNVLPLAEMGSNRIALKEDVSRLTAGGDTALLDAIRTAYVRLQQTGDRERINAIVAMTDGRENNSAISVNQLVDQIKQGNDRGVPVVIFCIAFGNDADYKVLQAVADASKGQVRQGDLSTIRQLYKIVSTYF